MNQSIRIDRLELDLRGMDPAVAEAAVRLLGPALQAELGQRRGPIDSAAHVDAGRVAVTNEPRALASRLAHRIVNHDEER